ncbi:MAG: PHP domain-containing protein [Candidatus Methanomethylicaceae archaeon]
MKVVFDPHIHTNSSLDSSITPNQLLGGLLAAGINAVAITDHDSMEGYRRIKHNSAFRDLLLVPGIEVSTDAGDLIVLGLEDPPVFRDPLILVERVHRAGGIVLAPHPFDGSRRSIGTLCDKLGVDIVEVFNGRCVGDGNREAKEFANALGLPGVGGSDAHQKEEIGSVINVLECERTIEGILRALKKGCKTVVRKKPGARWGLIV